MQVRKDTSIRQKEIVSAARKLIVKSGSEHVTIRRIATEIGVSEGAFYRHFKSKKDVLFLLINDIEETLNNDIDKNYPSETSSIEILEKIVKDQISAIEKKRGVTFQVIAEIISLGDKKLNKRIYEVIEKYLNRIKEILLSGIKSGEIRADIDPAGVALLFFSMIQGLVNIWALKQYNFNLEQEFKPLWNSFLKPVIKT